MSNRVRYQASPLLVLVLLGTTGCQTWQTHTGDVSAVITPAPSSPPPVTGGVPGFSSSQYAAAAKADTVQHLRVTTSSRGTFDLWNPRVAGDSLFGEVVKGGPEFGFPVADITKLQTGGTSAVKTAALAGGILVGAIVVSLGVLASVCGDSNPC